MQVLSALAHTTVITRCLLVETLVNDTRTVNVVRVDGIVCIVFDCCDQTLGNTEMFSETSRITTSPTKKCCGTIFLVGVMNLATNLIAALATERKLPAQIRSPSFQDHVDNRMEPVTIHPCHGERGR